MKNMKIGIIAVGGGFSYTSDEAKNSSCDLSSCKDIDKKVTDELINELSEKIKNYIPSNAETFTGQANSENEAIDLEEADAYILIPFAVPDIIYAVIYAKNKPVLIYIPPYEQIWSYGAVYYPYFVRDARKLDQYTGMKNQVYVCKNLNDLCDTVHALSVRYKISNSTVLCIGEAMYEPYHSWNWGYEMIRLIQEKFGVNWKHISSDKFLQIYNSSNVKTSGSLTKEAALNRMPEGFDSDKPEKMYKVFDKLIKEYNADAFTVNCLYSIVHTQCETTACYALSKLNDKGVVSACEADITTLLDMMITSYACDSPVFMLNPYLFPEDNKLFVSHCTSPTLHSFTSDEKDDFNAYTYYEIPSLPSGIQVIKKQGPVTVTGISHDKLDKMIVIRGNIVKNTAFPSCRTQMVLNVKGDIKELAECYEGRHWAMAYGDQTQKLTNANKLLGIDTQII